MKHCQMLLHGLIRRYINYHMSKGIEIGVYPGQAVILQVLSEMEGCNQRRLSDLLNVKTTTITVNLRRMENAGLVYKTVEESDRRLNHVYLTPLGREKAEQINTLFEEEGKFLFEDYTPDELKQIENLLTQLYEKLEQKSPKRKKVGEKGMDEC